MATQNAIDTGKPIEVSKGGTGSSSLTANRVLLGNGTGAIATTNSGTTGYLLVGSGAAPAFSSTADNDFAFDGAVAGATRTVRSQNKSSAANSDARIQITVTGATGGDSYVHYEIDGAGTNWATGLDNGDSDKFKISSGGTIGTTDTFVVTTTGEITKPLQPAFLAYLGSTDSDVTGDGTAYTLGSGNALTKVYDQNVDFNTNGTFTAPVTGRYFLTAALRVSDLAINHTSGELYIVTSNGSFKPCLYNPANMRSNDNLQMIGSIQCDMDASDTATVQCIIYNGAKVVDVTWNSRNTHFSGNLIC